MLFRSQPVQSLAGMGKRQCSPVERAELEGYLVDEVEVAMYALSELARRPHYRPRYRKDRQYWRMVVLVVTCDRS